MGGALCFSGRFQCSVGFCKYRSSWVFACSQTSSRARLWRGFDLSFCGSPLGFMHGLHYSVQPGDQTGRCGAGSGTKVAEALHRGRDASGCVAWNRGIQTENGPRCSPSSQAHNHKCAFGWVRAAGHHSSLRNVRLGPALWHSGWSHLLQRRQPCCIGFLWLLGETAVNLLQLGTGLKSSCPAGSVRCPFQASCLAPGYTALIVKARAFKPCSCSLCPAGSLVVSDFPLSSFWLVMQVSCLLPFVFQIRPHLQVPEVGTWWASTVALH